MHITNLFLTVGLLGAAAADTSQPNPLDYAPDFSKDPEPPFPAITNSDGSNITTQNWRGTRLYGWEGCGKPEIDIIKETYTQYHKLATAKGLKKIDFSSQAAREIWGTDVTDAAQTQIQQIFDAHAQVYDKYWWIPTNPPFFANWRFLWINVRCSPDGDDGTCGDKKGSNDNCANDQPPSKGKLPTVEAHSDNTQTYGTITFCNIFFNGYPNYNGRSDPIYSLDDVIGQAKKQSTSWRNDLWNYQNRARIFFHEMSHLDYFMNAPGSSPYTTDVKITIGSGKGRYTDTAYGPNNVKILANFKTASKGGYYPQRNADNFAWFAMANYIDQELSLYPNEPNELRKPVRAPTNKDGKKLDAADTDDDGNDNATVAVNPGSHWTPGCPDYVGPSLLGAQWGATSVDEKDPIDCPKEQLSGIDYTVFAGGNSTPSVFDGFCQAINSSTSMQWTVDASGNKASPVKTTKLKGRTPPPNPKSYGQFRFNLSWEPNKDTQGCGQYPGSCWKAFSDIANGPCGHQGGESNILTAVGNHTVPGCGTYSYSISGPLPPPSNPQPSNPQPSSQPSKPDFNSDACKACKTNISPACFGPDEQCLTDACKNTDSCKKCGIDCNKILDLVQD